MPLIILNDGESIESALKRFKKKCERAGVMTELRKRQHYEKPSVKKKKKQIASRKKLMKKLYQERRLYGE